MSQTMNKATAADRCLYPLFMGDVGGPPAKASMLAVAPCPIDFARKLNSVWHSRLPYTQSGPWKMAFAATFDDVAYAVALWHNSSARTLPGDWLELRRMAVAPDAPHCTASFMLAKMAKWIKANMPDVPRLISYQDMDVHQGTIYKAAGWNAAYISKPRLRDRSKPRTNTNRDYRSNSNGVAVDGAPKTRWELELP